MHGLYGPCKVTESGVTLELVKSHCARRHQAVQALPASSGWSRHSTSVCDEAVRTEAGC